MIQFVSPVIGGILTSLLTTMTTIIGFITVFFEMLAGLIEKDSLSIPDIDRLYGYHFFIATNCKQIQDMELVPYGDYYEGIFKVYPKWRKYRINNNKTIPFDDTPLCK